MDDHVHYELTRRWAIEEGLSAEDAEVVARADSGVDARHPGGLLHVWNWHYHYRLFGAFLLARRGAARAVDTGSLLELGKALHRFQDTVAHGWLGLARHAVQPYCDRWDRRSARDRGRIEAGSRAMLRAVARRRAPKAAGSG